MTAAPPGMYPKCPLMTTAPPLQRKPAGLNRLGENINKSEAAREVTTSSVLVTQPWSMIRLVFEILMPTSVARTVTFVVSCSMVA